MKTLDWNSPDANFTTSLNNENTSFLSALIYFCSFASLLLLTSVHARHPCSYVTAATAMKLILGCCGPTIEENEGRFDTSPVPWSLLPFSAMHVDPKVLSWMFYDAWFVCRTVYHAVNEQISIMP